MKIAIVGCGIGGLSTYLWLRKELAHQEEHEINIYESHQSVKPRLQASVSTQELPAYLETEEYTPKAADAIGSVIVLSPNGLRVLQRLDEELFHDVTSTGAPLATYLFKSAYGFTLMQAPAGSRGAEKMTCVVIARQGLWHCLRRRVPNEAIQVSRVSEVVASPGALQNVIRFSDGTYNATADIVIGADGVNSVVRKAVLGDHDYLKYAPVYEGLVSVGGFIPSSQLPDDPESQGAMNLVWGGAGCFGYGSCSTLLSAPGRHLPLKALPAGDVAWWGSVYMVAEHPDKRNLNTEDIREQLRERHGNWKDRTVRYCVENARIESLYPISTLPILPTWNRSNVVLIGDAAHCLLPSSGQGACQALEDAEALAHLLIHYLHKAYGSVSLSDDEDRPITEYQAVAVAAKKFFKMRTPRIKKISDDSRVFDLNKSRGVFEEWMLYLIIWALGFFGKFIGRFIAKGDPMKALVDYDLPAAVELVIAEGILEADFESVSEYRDDSGG